MSVQVITRDGVPEYAVLAWDEYQALLKAARQHGPATPETVGAATRPGIGQLSALREAKDMSQEELAKSVGISPAYLSLIESGERDPGDVILRSLARALEIEGWETEA